MFHKIYRNKTNSSRVEFTIGRCSCNILCQAVAVRQRKNSSWSCEAKRLSESFIYDPRASFALNNDEAKLNRRKNCLKFHSAEDKRQQSYVYEEQAGKGASKTWKTRYHFVKDWSNNGSDSEKKIRFTKFIFAAFSSSAFSRW